MDGSWGYLLALLAKQGSKGLGNLQMVVIFSSAFLWPAVHGQSNIAALVYLCVRGIV
jgi:hypothetical protein